MLDRDEKGCRRWPRYYNVNTSVLKVPAAIRRQFSSRAHHIQQALSSILFYFILLCSTLFMGSVLLCSVLFLGSVLGYSQVQFCSTHGLGSILFHSWFLFVAGTVCRGTQGIISACFPLQRAQNYFPLGRPAEGSEETSADIALIKKKKSQKKEKNKHSRTEGKEGKACHPRKHGKEKGTDGEVLSTFLLITRKATFLPSPSVQHPDHSLSLWAKINK